MADPTIAGLRVLRAVVDAGSFTAAAEALGYTQSAVSKQVRALETATGAVLFRRAPRGVEPTDAGSALSARAATILDEVDAADRELSRLADAVTGRVALGAFPTAAMSLVPRVIRGIRSDHPALAVEFQQASSPTQLGRLRSGRLDVAVVAVGTGLDDYDLSGLRAEPLAQGPLLVAVASSHPFAGRRRIPATELDDQEWIAGDGARGDPQFGAWPTLVAPRIAFAVRDWPARFGFVAAGLGITTVPALVARSVPAGIRLVDVDDPSWRGRDALVVTRTDRSPETAIVVEAVAREAARMHADGYAT